MRRGGKKRGVRIGGQFQARAFLIPMLLTEEKPHTDFPEQASAAGDHTFRDSASGAEIEPVINRCIDPK